MSMLLSWERIIDDLSEADTTVSFCTGLMHCAKAWMVVPEARMMESL